MNKVVVPLLCVATSILISGNALAWELRQVKVNHVQVGNADQFYITVAGDVASASGCSNMPADKGWMSFSLGDMNERKKTIISFALAAQASGQLVDVGSTVSGCNSLGTADIQFIRIGDWRK